VKVAIHQPNYLPWIGYFYKMHLCDTFVILDDVQFSKSGYTRRVNIRKDRWGDALTWLTLSLKKYHQHTLITQLEVDDTAGWFDTHQRKLRAVYGGEMYYDRIIGLIEYAVSDVQSTKIVDINNAIISHISNYLYVNPKVVISSDVKITDDYDDVNLTLVKATEGTHYISGLGGDKYQQTKDFKNAGVNLSYANIQGFLKSSNGLLANPLGADIGASIFDWLVRYSNTEIKELFRAAESAEEY